MKLFQIYDKVAMTVAGVIMSSARPEAIIRDFTELLANPNTQLHKYPDDFILLEIGEQNQNTGELTPCDPKTIYTGSHWKRLQANPDSSSPANTNGAGEQPSGLVDDENARQVRFEDWSKRVKTG